MKNSNNKFLLIIMILFLSACSGGGSDDDGPVVINPPIDDPMDDDPLNADLAGGYKGTWTSTTATASFNGVAISARIVSNADETKVSGDFFITSNFTVCCSAGDNDGTIAMDINGNTISNFSYNDVITNCSGSFIGSGVKSGPILIIDFTGTDCDGDHIGQIILEKTEN